MEISINNGILANELRLLNKITPAKPTMAELGHVLFTVDGGECTISATNLEVMMTIGCKQAKVTADGQFLLPAKTLFDIAERLANVDVVMTLDKTHVNISAGAFKSRLSTARVENFPTIPQAEGEILTLPASSLAALIDRVQYAIPDKAQNYVLTGALLILHPTMGLVAVDGKRLSMSIDSHQHPTPIDNVVIPKQTLDVLHDHCDGASQVQFSRAANHLFFGVDNRMLVSRVLDGTFPNYKPIIPQDCSIIIPVSRSLLAAALRRVGVLSEESRAIDFTFKENVLLLTSGSITGDAIEEITVVYTGEPFTVCANGNYVLEFLEHAVNSQISMQFKTTSSPMLLTDGERFLNVITILKR